MKKNPNPKDEVRAEAPWATVNVFWSHACRLVAKGKSFDMELTRSSFCDESKTVVYPNTNNSKELMLCLYGCDMAAMGAMGVSGSGRNDVGHGSASRRLLETSLISQGK